MTEYHGYSVRWLLRTWRHCVSIYTVFVDEWTAAAATTTTRRWGAFKQSDSRQNSDLGKRIKQYDCLHPNYYSIRIVLIDHTTLAPRTVEGTLPTCTTLRCTALHCTVKSCIVGVLVETTRTFSSSLYVQNYSYCVLLLLNVLTCSPTVLNSIQTQSTPTRNPRAISIRLSHRAVVEYFKRGTVALRIAVSLSTLQPVPHTDLCFVLASVLVSAAKEGARTLLTIRL